MSECGGDIIMIMCAFLLYAMSLMHMHLVLYRKVIIKNLSVNGVLIKCQSLAQTLLSIFLYAVHW